MLCIISEEVDSTTDIVCNWLNYYQCPFIRINREKTTKYEVVVCLGEQKEEIIIKRGITEYNLSDIEKVWFRRGLFDFRQGHYDILLDNTAKQCIDAHLSDECNTLESFLYYILKQKNGINHPFVYNYNKLTALHEAQKAGLKIPQTLITGNGEIIRNFIAFHEQCITKNIQDVIFLRFDDNSQISQSTVRIKKEEIKLSKYWYSLFQKEITKKYELRIFFFMGKFYTAAIFSQRDPTSSIDFRNVDINGERPNRIVPFSLPTFIKNKIRKLMKTLKLESGSIDIIVDKQDDYYFLEVNPVGQFNFVGQICNYYIEKNIAQNLAI